MVEKIKQYFLVVRMVVMLAFSSVPSFLRFLLIPVMWSALNMAAIHNSKNRTTFGEIFKVWSDYALLRMLHHGKRRG